MRVLHVYRTYFPDTQGGLEEAIRQLCIGTSALGVENRVFMLSRDPDPAIISFTEAQVYRFPLNFEIASCGFSLRCLSGFKELVAWADVVQYHFPWPFADLLHFMARVRKPTIVAYQSDVIRQQGLLRLYRPLKRKFLASVDRIVATSPNYVITSQALQGCAAKVTVIPIGLTRVSYPMASAVALDDIANRFGRDFFLFVGVLRYYKGLHILLQAMENAEFTVVIAGAGPVEAELKVQAEQLNLTNIHFLGFVSDEVKVALFQLSLAVVFPSHLRSEAFGVTLVEGAMFSKPLISAEIGSGMSYINIHGETGLVVPPSDPHALREALDKLFNDQELAQRMGQAAHARYEMLFTGKIMGEHYVRLYKELLSEASV